MKKINVLTALFFFVFLSNNIVFAQTEELLEGEKIAIICEGKKGSLECDQFEVIEIIDVFWGREADSDNCNNAPTGLVIDRVCKANAENALQKVNGQCKNEQMCEIVASNIFFDDNSCGNVYKYLRVKYRCVPEN